MKKTRKQAPEERVRELYPNFDAECAVEVFVTDIDPTDPHKKTENVVLFGRDELVVWRNGDICLREPIKNIERVSLGRGVGCCWVEYTQKSEGETILVARADNSGQARLGKAIKRINRFLRHGVIESEEGEGDVEGKICPKCQKPYPRGSHVCPHCASKTRAVRRLLSMASTAPIAG